MKPAAPKGCRSERAVVEAGAMFKGGHDPWHLVIVTAGSFSEQCDGRIYDLGRGDCRLSPPGQLHDIAVGSEEMHCSIFELPDDWIGSGGRLLESQARSLFANDRAILDDLTAEDPDELDLTTALRRDLRVRAALARLQADGQELGEPPDWLKEARDSLSVASGARVDRIAARAAVSREHLTRAFVKYYGCSPAAYRGSIRLIEALGLLSRTDMAIAEIANDTGYFDQSHLTRSVRAYSGATPASLR